MKVGALIKYYRELYNLTQTEIAELAGINEKYYGRIERDESVPTIDKVEELCYAFDIRFSDLLMIDPTKIQRKSFEHSDALKYIYEEAFYCNCCGYVFQTETTKDIICPNCGCMYEEDNDYIEKIRVEKVV